MNDEDDDEDRIRVWLKWITTNLFFIALTKRLLVLVIVKFYCVYEKLK